MQLLRDFQTRLQCAATLKTSAWVSIIALVAGAIVARLLIFLAPATGSDVAKAKQLGIVSLSILTGYSESAESFAYALALAGAIATSLTIWFIWALRAGKNEIAQTQIAARATPRTNWIEFGIVSVVAFGLFARFWNGYAATVSGWGTLTEEGEMLAWVETVLRGGALSRDVFCLYGPLSTWLVAGIFSVFGPSLGLWRTWMFALNAPALIGIYYLLRGITRTRIAAAIGAIAIGLVCLSPIAAMSWSLARVGLGLGAFAALNRALNRDSRIWYFVTGLLIATTLLYSQEVGIACAIATGAVILFGGRLRLNQIMWSTIGVAVVLLPAIVYLIGTHSFSATIENLFLFPRVRMLGYAACPFPSLRLNADSLRAYFIPAVLAVSAFFTGIKLLRGVRDARVFTEAGLLLFAALLFTAPLSRPDDTHLTFVMPPALVLLTSLFEDGCFALRSRDFRAPALIGLVVAMAMLATWFPSARMNLLNLFEGPSGRKLQITRGGCALLPDDFARDLESVTREIQARTAPNEPFWAFPNEALLYFLADRPQPTHFPQTLFAVTRAQREQLVADLERTRPRWTVVYLDAPQVDGIPYNVAIPEVVAYLAANYEPETSIGSFAILRRKN